MTTTRRAFFSFDHQRDAWRASQIREIGTIGGNSPVSDNDWEQVKRGGDAAIRRGIDEQMRGRTCVVVLIGAQTANRKWINYEIDKAWNDGKGIFGVYVHKLKDQDGKQSRKGVNPFYHVLDTNGRRLRDRVKTYEIQSEDSTKVYATIKRHLASWVEQAIADRRNG